MDGSGRFKGRHFTAEVILWAVRWYLMFPNQLPRSGTHAARPWRLDATFIVPLLFKYLETLEERFAARPDTDVISAAERRQRGRLGDRKP
jgi:hypothetical protein